jgi:hypothetical protein
MKTHQCDLLEYEGQTLELVHEGTGYQRWVFMSADHTVILQVVMFCPCCGLDCRKDAKWQVPGKPQFNELVNKARHSGLKAWSGLGHCALCNEKAVTTINGVAYCRSHWVSEAIAAGIEPMEAGLDES